MADSYLQIIEQKLLLQVSLNAPLKPIYLALILKLKLQSFRSEYRYLTAGVRTSVRTYGLEKYRIATCFALRI